MKFFRTFDVPRRVLACIVVAFVAFTQGLPTPATGIDNIAAFLEQAETIPLTDHPRFLVMMAQLQAEERALDERQKWRLRFLEAYELEYEGRSHEAEPRLHDIIDHSGSPGLVAKATAQLLNGYALTRRYEDVFTLAQKAATLLSTVDDVKARFSLLSHLSQSLNFAGNPSVALQYARMMKDSLPPGKTLCTPLALELAARYNAKTLPWDTPDFDAAAKVCLSTNDTVFANSIWLNQATRMVEEHQIVRAKEVLDRIAASIEHNGYHPALTSYGLLRAQIDEQLGHDDLARKEALAVIGMFEPGETDTYLRDIYEMLYRIEKRASHDSAALDYYQKFAVQERANLDDISARTIAYQAVEQHMLIQKADAERLQHQNDVLKLENAITMKAIETSRLHMVLLAVILVSVAAWAIRVRRSQRRFMRLSQHDGLTGLFNHQHFMAELENALADMHRRKVPGCVVLLDLDHFKSVNDDYGHAIGDAVLQHVVDVCRAQLGPGDMVGRLGGEEFGILLPQCTLDRGMTVAEQIRIALEESPVTVDGHTVTCLTSAGVSSTDLSGYELKTLRNDADDALYEAKRGGRNRVVASMHPKGVLRA